MKRTQRAGSESKRLREGPNMWDALSIVNQGISLRDCKQHLTHPGLATCNAARKATHTKLVCVVRISRGQRFDEY